MVCINWVNLEFQERIYIKCVLYSSLLGDLCINGHHNEYSISLKLVLPSIIFICHDGIAFLKLVHLCMRSGLKSETNCLRFNEHYLNKIYCILLEKIASIGGHGMLSETTGEPMRDTRAAYFGFGCGSGLGRPLTGTVGFPLGLKPLRKYRN
jgi:hypothetical protein